MTSMKDIKIEDYLFGPCSESLLEQLATKDEYWKSCKTFLFMNRGRKISELSFKQKAWLFKISDGLLKEAGHYD